jgi:hypothetical protein
VTLSAWLRIGWLVLAADVVYFGWMVGHTGEPGSEGWWGERQQQNPSRQTSANAHIDAMAPDATAPENATSLGRRTRPLRGERPPEFG